MISSFQEELLLMGSICHDLYRKNIELKKGTNAGLKIQSASEYLNQKILR
jgi:hypothetical protein